MVAMTRGGAGVALAVGEGVVERLGDGLGLFFLSLFPGPFDGLCVGAIVAVAVSDGVLLGAGVDALLSTATARSQLICSSSAARKVSRR